MLEETELDGDTLAEILELGEREAEALADGETDAEAELLGDTELDGEIEALGEADTELLGLRDDDGLSDDEGDREALAELEGLVEAEGEIDALGEVEAEGEREAETLMSAKADSRCPSLVIGFQITVNLIVPLVTGAVPIVRIMSSETIFSVKTLVNSILASGALSCQISLASISVPVVCAISPVVLSAVPTASVAEAPARSTAQVARTLSDTVPVTLKRV